MAQFRGDARLSTWLTRIIVNQALERRRRVPAGRAPRCNRKGRARQRRQHPRNA